MNFHSCLLGKILEKNIWKRELRIPHLQIYMENFTTKEERMCLMTYEELVEKVAYEISLSKILINESEPENTAYDYVNNYYAN